MTDKTSTEAIAEEQAPGSRGRTETQSLANKVAVVTGASSGIGKAIARALVDEGSRVCLVGRRLEKLEEVARLFGKGAHRPSAYRVDLTRDEDIDAMAKELQRCGRSVDILVHCAGEIHHARHADASIADLDAQYRSNVRGPYLLTKSLLPLIRGGSAGDVVFINSTSGLRASARAGQFAATQHAMKAIADSLREEVNVNGIRVLSVFPGRTATPRTKTLFHEEGKPYQPDLLMQPEDVAMVVIHALKMPRTAELTEITIRPLLKSY
jgi:NADP-dependent 3-hydroxy acid dehydrogenase YdfG